MARQTLVTLIDDRDGSEAQETVEFALDGKSYEIDLNDKHAAEIRDALAPFVAAARRVGRGSVTSIASSTSSAPRRDLSEVRTWLAENGYTVSGRGRIRAELLQAYESRTPANTLGSEGNDQPTNDAPVETTDTEATEEKPKRSRKAKEQEAPAEGETEGGQVVEFRQAN